jgi:sec-independent protein translocase protein TatB
VFDIGFSELLLTGLVALIVFGPERLPGAARTAGLWIGRLKRSFGAIKAEVEREMGADEIRRQLHNEQILQMERELKQSIQPPTPPASEAPVSPPQSEAPAAPPTAAAPVATATPPAPSPANLEPPRQP